jgi:hypothetical protein
LSPPRSEERGLHRDTHDGAKGGPSEQRVFEERQIGKRGGRFLDEA